MACLSMFMVLWLLTLEHRSFLDSSPLHTPTTTVGRAPSQGLACPVGLCCPSAGAQAFLVWQACQACCRAPRLQ